MTVTSFNRGHEIYYNTENNEWYYTETNTKVSSNEDIECSRCNKKPINDIDCCLYSLKDAKGIESACCGHGVEKSYIMLKDGRRFEEVIYDD